MTKYVSRERMTRFILSVNRAFRGRQQELSLEKCIKEGLTVGGLLIKVYTAYPNNSLFRRLHPNGREENGKWVVD